MPEVYNWQLGRKMLYPYEERHPKWQFAFVFNINRCLACQTCSMADKSTWLFSKGQEYMWWNNVETKPYGGYPQFYDVKITQLIEQVNPGGQVWNVRVGRKHHAPYGVFDLTIDELTVWHSQTDDVDDMTFEFCRSAFIDHCSAYADIVRSVHPSPFSEPFTNPRSSMGIPKHS